MNDDFLVRELHSLAAEGKSPADMIGFVVAACGVDARQMDVVRVFKAAFDNVPLRTLIEVGAYCGLGDQETLDQAKINELLGPWLNASSEA